MTAIFFDLDGTLLHFTKNYDDIIEETFIEVCGYCGDGWVESYSDAFFEHFDNLDSEPYVKAFDEIWEEEPRVLRNELQKREFQMCQKPSKIGATLDDLSTDYTLGVITNGVDEWQREKLQEHNLTGYFGIVITSYEIGEHKPSKAPFLEAQSRTNTDEFLMIGDSIEHDIKTPESMNWDTYHYNQGSFESLRNLIG